MKKIIAFLLATVICFSITPYNALATVITKTSEVNSVIDNISDDNIKSKIKGVLAEYPSGSSFSNSYNWADKINPKITTDSKVGSVKQCYGFALYVYASIFGLHGGGVKKDYTNDYESNKLLSGEHTASYQSFLNSGVKAGAHIRTTDNFSSVTDSNDGGHSMIVLHYDANYLYVYHGNADGSGGVSVTQWTWDNFNKKQLGGRSTPRRIKYVAVPKLQYYHTCPSDGKNNQGEYGYETYKSGSTTVFGACKQCHKPYDWQGSFKKMNSTTYEIKSSSKSYVVKVRSLPYDGAPVLFDKVSKTFTIIGEVTNAYGNKWYAIDFQDDAKKQCYTAYVYGGQIDEHYNATTTEVKAKEYKSANVVTHKHDYTYGNGKCYCGATKIVEPEKSSLKINLTSYPTSIKQGSSFGLIGTISSNYNIKKVKGYIKQGDTVYASSEDTPNNKKLDVKTAALNKSLVFGKLPVGNYSLCVEAVDTSGQTVRVNKNFSVYEEQKKDASTLSINLERYPVSINLGSSYSVRGNVSSNYTISKVRGYIYDSNGSVVQSTTDTPNSTYMEIRPANLNQKLIFGKLSSGNYTMKVEAVDASGKVVTATKNFTVKGGENTPSGAPIKFEIETVPKGNMPYGKDFTLKGWFRSDSAIAETRAYILDENKNVIMQSDSASSTTSNYKIEGYKLDKGIKFDQLSPGGYYLKYYVRDADGDTSTWVSDKFYIVKENTSSGSSSSAPSTNTSQTTSIRFEIESMPKGNLPYGKSFSLKGWFRSDSPIVEARAYMMDANKNIVMQSDPASSTTSNYKIQGYKLDKAMKFDKLSPGGYYLKFFVRDANGDTFTWVSDKFYIVK